jgi:uncharacterized glyoxalase superfamily protein PhnB
MPDRGLSVCSMGSVNSRIMWMGNSHQPLAVGGAGGGSRSRSMTVGHRLALVTYLARDHDEAIAWLRRALGFVLLEDTDLGGGKRWVRMAAKADAETAFLVARATGDQTASIGGAAGGRVAYFLHTHDFEASAARLAAAGVTFEEGLRHEAYGRVAVFRDLYGNRWDLIEPGMPAGASRPGA